MRSAITAVLLAVLVSGSHLSPSFAQTPPRQTRTDVQGLGSRLRQRFQILPLRDGVALTPRFRSPVRSIEVSGGTIGVDGDTVTGAELGRKLGTDAELVLQVSYLDPSSLRELLGLSATPQAATEVPAPSPQAPSTRTAVRRGDVVRFGGSVTVSADETVTGDVVVIGGSANVDGQVEGDLVVIGGTARLGPRAEIRRDVTVVGGRLDRDPGSVIGGKVDEVGVGGGPQINRQMFRRGMFSGWPFGAVSPAVRFVGTLVRIALIVLLVWIVVLVAHTPVEGIAERAAAEPVKSWVIGFLAELLFLPVLILTVVMLAVSIIGIPLLLLVPLALVGVFVIFLVGFAGVTYRVGRRAEGDSDKSRRQPYLATLIGIAVILSPLLLGRIVGLMGGLGFLATGLVALGGLLEYVAWTVGLGAAALVRFGRPLPSSAPSQPQQSMPPAEAQA